MLRPKVVTLIAMVVLPAVVFEQPSSGAEVHWPGWRGPGRDGWVKGFQPPAHWPEKLERVWRVEVGTGYGSPIVSGDRVYQHARQGDEEVVWCLDTQTGAVKWRQSYAAPFTIGQGAEFHGKGPKSSPVLAGGRLFTLSITGRLSVWDAASGEPLWSRDYTSRFKKGHPYWGASTSPLIDGGRVVVRFGTDDQGTLIALDAKNGEEIWSHGNEGASYASPILVEIDGVRQIVELTMKGLVGVEAESGRRLWDYSAPQVGTDQNMVTPVYHRGLVLLGGENRGIRGLEPRRDNGDWTVKERWHQKRVALDMSSAVMNGDLLYGFSHYGKGRFFCLDPRMGEIRWQGPPRTGENSMFLSVPGHVVALIDDGELKIIEATGERFKPVASYRVSDSPTWAPPVLLERGVLVKDEQSLAFWSFGGSTTGSRSPSR